MEGYATIGVGIGCTVDVDCPSGSRRDSHSLERTSRNNTEAGRTGNWNRRVSRTIRSHVSGHDKLSQCARGLTVLWVNSQHAGGQSANGENITSIQDLSASSPAVRNQRVSSLAGTV